MASFSPTRVLLLGILAAAAAALACLVGALVLYPMWEEYRATPISKLQPNRINFGVVCVDAAVEGSVRFFFDKNAAGGCEPKIRNSGFVKILDTIVGNFSTRSEEWVTCDLFFAVNATKPGQFSTSIKALMGNHIGEIPVSITIVPRPANTSRVLVASTPFDCYSTEDASLFDPLLELVRSARIDIHYTRALPGDLAGFEVILLAEEELCVIDAQKVSRLVEFVNSGGRLIVCANAFFQRTVAKANEILEKFGLQMEDKEPHREVDAETITQDLLTAGVKKLSFFRPSPIKALDPGNPIDPNKVKLLVESPFDKDRAYAAVARHHGEVIVLGQSLWWSWIKNADNARLMKNFLVKSQSNLEK